MASTYTGSGIEKIATGEQSGTWGTTTNTNFDILDRLINGVGTITLSGTTHTLTTTDGTLSDGMFKVLGHPIVPVFLQRFSNSNMKPFYSFQCKNCTKH